MPKRQWRNREVSEFVKKYGHLPFFTQGGEGEEDPPEKKQVIFESQEDVDKMVQKAKADAEKAAEKKLRLTLKDELTEEVTKDIQAKLAADKKKTEGEYEKLYEDVIRLTKGAIPEDSLLAEVIKNSKGRVDDLEEAITSLIEQQTELLSDDLKDLIPDDLSPEATLKWLAKALSKNGKKEGDESKTGEKRVTTVRNPKPRGTGGTTVDETIKELRESRRYRKA